MSVIEESPCCTEEGECECSDECLIEYASHLCSMDTEHGDEGTTPSELDDCCTGDEMRFLPEDRPPARRSRAESAMSGWSLPENFEPPPRHPEHVLRRRITATPCSRHLNMASEYANDYVPKGAATESSSSADATYVSSIANIIRRCFCRGPRRFIFPNDKNCCTIRRERMQAVNPSHKFSTILSKPSTDEIPIVDKPQRSPETDIEQCGADQLCSLTLGVVGMTCTGCESKLRRVLNSFPGISDVRTSFILNRADIVYDPLQISDPVEITAQVKKVTGFICTVLRTGLAVTDIPGERVHVANLDTEGKDRIQEIDGVSQVMPIRGGTFEIIYDPQTIGIRDILEVANSHIGGGGGVHLALNSSSEEVAQAVEDSHWFWMIVRTAVAVVLTVPVLVFAWAPIARNAPFPDQTYFICSAFALATVVQLLAIPIYKHAFQSLVYQKEIDMDVLVSLSITSAYIYSIVSFAFELRDKTEFTALGHPIFETSSLLVTLILLGRLMAAWVRRKAQNSIKLGGSQSKAARVIKKSSIKTGSATPFATDSDDCEPEFIDSSLLHYGDIIQGKESEHIVTDGIIIDGSAEMDEAHITGETDPVVRSKKSYVYAGSIIFNGQINYRVTRLVSENTLSIVKHLVSTAASSRTKILERADLAASYLTPLILAVACAAFLVWVLINKLVRDWADTGSSINALTHAISILAISCPCALALAVPMVLTVSSTVGAKKGVLFKTGAALEVGHQVSHVVFDKTGTLTSGQLSLVREIFCEESGESNQDVRKIAAMVTNNNRHPVSLAIKQHLASHVHTDATNDPAEHPKIIIGKGVKLTTEKGTIKGGSPSWLGLETHPAVKPLLDESLTTFCVTRNDTLLVVYGLTSTVRPEAASILEKLRSKKITTHLLSGDNNHTVTAVATQLNFDMDNVRSLCLPDSKAAYIKDLQAQSVTSSRRLGRLGRRSGSGNKVLFVGDGTNDAPALSQADLGVCMTNSTDIAADAADVGIISGSLHGVLAFLELSQRATRRIQINIVWAVLYNVFAVLLAGGAFEAVGFRIMPSYAGVGEMVSLLPVIGVSLSLGWRGWR
ncbi:hypothetical protein FQN51_001143 [Onygenales sp. PD_10]|nr:hypothetical protein FQN51_001143 [Onygenales sp. PD_10]